MPAVVLDEDTRRLRSLVEQPDALEFVFVEALSRDGVMPRDAGAYLFEPLRRGHRQLGDLIAMERTFFRTGSRPAKKSADFKTTRTSGATLGGSDGSR